MITSENVVFEAQFFEKKKINFIVNLPFLYSKLF